MRDHTEPRFGGFWRGLASRKVRAVLCLGIFAAPAAVGTMAYWTDEATIESGTFTAGTLDLTVGGAVEDSNYLPGPGGTHEYSTLTIADLLPGESIARPFIVRNFGTTRFIYNGFVHTTNNALAASGNEGGLQVAIYAGGSPTNAGTQAAGDRSGSCPGGDLLKNQEVSTSTNTVELAPADIPLAPGATQTHCVVVLLDLVAPNALQGARTQLIVELDAKQMGAP
ncbi:MULTISPECIES: TasA family protein [Arthrobacter]|uniref:TasA family protein n=1 Tax=Arthrobacter TaxID=1663 RepID=UPI00078533B2|nr:MULTISPECIES: TasA family protein [Arthrobacter]